MTASLDIFRALADPTRLRIVALLRAMELSVGELAQVLAQSQPRVSRHVKILCDAGLAKRRKEGSWVFLCPGEAARVGPLFAALDQWDKVDGRDHWVLADAARLAAVRADRATAAQAYFDAQAGQWDAIRSLHVAESDVEAAMERVLDGQAIGRLVDIGTGTGRMIELFGARATHALGIDRSPEMLADGSADTVILHQVLHFLPAPELAITEAARLVAGKGRLLIVDFAPHDHEELRTSDAHARLGFSDAQIKTWFATAGLQLERSEELAGGSLTVKLWCGIKLAETLLKVVSA
jgi:DNA-binding transcriptional ArsR family regulator